MSVLFSPLTLRDITFRNRVFVSPMCEYSAGDDGLPTPWHLVHLGSRAVGGAGLVMTEATAVSPEGRISNHDLGLWDDRQIPSYREIVTFIRSQGAIAGMQIAHAGRKGSTAAPWCGDGPLPPEQAWTTLAPDATPFSAHMPPPQAMSAGDLAQTQQAFVAAAQRALAAGFEVLEIHMAHGYLLHEFLSPLANHRTDAYGGDLAHRMRFPLEVATAVRAVWPERLPLFVRISATDWRDGGWDLAQSIELARALKTRGVDLIDCSSGGIVPHAAIPAGPGYQAPFAQNIRQQAQIATGAVGMITAPAQAEQIIATQVADVVFLARELLRDPYWPLHAAHALHVDIPWPVQYQRAKPR